MRDSGPRPTLGELQRSTPWIWLWCERCQHHAPLACPVVVIRWGPHASSDRLRASARCTTCGGKVQLSNAQDGPAITLAFNRFRLATATQSPASERRSFTSHSRHASARIRPSRRIRPNSQVRRNIAVAALCRPGLGSR
jgi:hypothetical protein